MQSGMFSQHQFGSIVHSFGERPKLLVVAIVIFSVIVFAFFIASYVYIFSGILKSNTVPVRNVSGAVDVFSDVSFLSDELTSFSSAKIVEDNQPSVAPEANTQTEVRINGKTVPVPVNGTVHKDLAAPNGNASINVSVQSQGSTNSRSSSSLRVTVNSSSDSTYEASQ